MQKKPEDLKAAVGNALSFFDEIGAEFVVRRTGPAPRPEAPGVSLPRIPEAMPLPRPAERDPAALEAIRSEVLGCGKCSLAALRAKAVPGEGGIESGLMFVGEAPGAEENVQGRPFVGKAGQLLTKIIGAMGFDRSEVYITNVVKCQPPGNRTPLSGEVEVCSPYLLRQIGAIRPSVIVALGSVAAGFFIPGDMKISGLRGTFFDFRGVRVMPTFHPSYVSRNEGNKQIKRQVWNDMQKVMALLGKK